MKNNLLDHDSADNATETNTGTPFYAWTAQEMSETFDITPRRIRQYAEDGLLPRLSRGRFDPGWLLHLRCGERRTANLKRKFSPITLVAIGWLRSVGAKPKRDDIEAGTALVERNGYTRDDFLLALGEASEIAGR